MKKALAVLFAVVMVVCVLTACGSKTPSGTYVAKTINGKSPIDYFTESFGGDKDTVLSMLGVDEKELNSNLMTMTFKKDGKVTIGGLMMTIEGEGEAEGTWKLDGTKLTITVDDKPEDFKFEKGKIIGTPDEGMEMVFAKK